MKSITYIFFLLLSTVFLSTACSDAFTGPDEATDLEGVTSTSGDGLADLSLRLDVDPYVQAGHNQQDPMLIHATVYVHNEGPDDATGIQIALTANTDCSVSEGTDDDDEPKGGDIILVDILGATSSTGEQGGGDIILVDLLGATVEDTSSIFSVECMLKGTEEIDLGLEIVRADQADPDSRPGNGDPDEDDQMNVRLYPEVPPCPDCPLTVGW